MKLVMICIAALSLSACAMGGLKKDWEARGYTEADIAEIHKYEDDYLEIASRGSAYATRFDSSSDVEAKSRLRNIICSCVKKLGDKCQQKPVNLSPEDRVSWAKANAAEDAMRSVASVQSFGITTAPVIDNAECK